MKQGSCGEPLCNRPTIARGLCGTHYEHRRRHDALPVITRAPLWVADNGCWVWQRALNDEGYGRIGDDYAHRFVYEQMAGPIPEGLTLDHLCRNRACVNPAHVEPVTDAVNILRGEGPSALNARKTRCNHGHELTSDNTYHPPKRPHVRQCRACKRERDRASYRRAHPAA